MSDRVGMGIEQAGEKKQRGEGSAIGEGKQAKKECMQAERGGGRGGGKEERTRAFTWTDHASNSLSLVFPYLKTPPSLLTKDSPCSLPDHLLHRFGCERFPIGPDSGTNDVTMAQG